MDLIFNKLEIFLKIRYNLERVYTDFILANAALYSYSGLKYEWIDL